MTISIQDQGISFGNTSAAPQLFPITCTVATNSLLLSLAPTTLTFRNPSLSSGTPVTVICPTLSITVPSGATLGTASNVSARLDISVAYNGGVPVLCVSNSSGVIISESGFVSPTAITSGATSGSTIYSASTVSANSPVRVIGYIDIVESVAGVWAAPASLVQGSGDSDGIPYMPFGAGVVATTVQSKLRESVSVKDFGAKGDGVTDDTAALTVAHNAGVPLDYPEGTYLISAPIPLNSHQVIRGVPSESYVDWVNDTNKANPSYYGKASIIQYKAGSHGTIFSGSGSGASINGMVFRVGQAQNSSDILMTAPGLTNFYNCKFESLWTVFNNTTGAYGVGKLIGNRFFNNASVFPANQALVDTVVMGNIFTSNGSCLNFGNGGGYLTIVGNRFEFNGQCINAFGTRSSLVTGNLFDCSSIAAISLYNSDNWAITGNKFNGSGYSLSGLAGQRSHIHLKGTSSGNTITGNTLSSARSDSGVPVTPYLIECESTSGKGNIYKANTDEFGWTTAPVLDTFATGNPAMLYDGFVIPMGIGNPNNSTTDALIGYVGGIQSTSTESVKVYVKEARYITNYSGGTKITLVGIGTAAIVITNGTGALSLGGAHNINYGGVTFNITSAGQTATTVPSGFIANGIWPLYAIILNAAPVSAGYIGWVKTASGSPDTWKQYGAIL